MVARTEKNGMMGKLLKPEMMDAMPKTDIQPWEVNDDDPAFYIAEELLSGDIDNLYQKKIIHGQFLWRIQSTLTIILREMTSMDMVCPIIMDNH